MQQKKEVSAVAEHPLRYCLYARKSTEADELQALSVDSQIKEMLMLAQKEGLQVVEVKKESHSAKASGQRPVFNKLAEEIRQSRFDGLRHCKKIGPGKNCKKSLQGWTKR